jgi:predicted nucleic-acid-binding protein
MPRFVETSVLIRYLTADPPEMAQRAARLIETDDDLSVTDTILVETAHVLRRLYGVAREDVADLLVRLLRRRNILVHGLTKEQSSLAFPRLSNGPAVSGLGLRLFSCRSGIRAATGYPPKGG